MDLSTTNRYNVGMESDFTTRHHIDSVTPFADPGIGELLLRYRQPPIEPKPVQFSGVENQSNSSSNLYISNMLGQLQGTLQSLTGNSKETNLSGTGLQLSINTDILRWMIVLAFAIVLVVVLFQCMNYRKTRNPFKRRLRRLENELKALRMRQNPFPQDDEEDLSE